LYCTGSPIKDFGDDKSEKKLTSKEWKMPIDQKLLEILACPKCKGDIRLNEDGSGLICDRCKLLYPIKDDIPIMLIEEAVSLA
jgi:uncharacterized protein YbaR (Trm112 family)